MYLTTNKMINQINEEVIGWADKNKMKISLNTLALKEVTGRNQHESI